MGGRQAATATTHPPIPAPAEAAAHLAGREVVIEPGGSTGWHYHRVPLIALVKSGTLTRILHDRTVVVHPPGSSFVEPAGLRHVHLGRNLGTVPVVLYVTSTLAEGEPFSLPAGPPPPGPRPAQTRRRISPRTR
ncbi:cupin domain-containing protein [Streptomyces sp. NPDC032472]|uniref:cupin domain-containing protein n=1 Tax=Streptomyces sp. NPDC032472 TaxID=3155018 RepID=UPI0033CB35C2